MLLTEHETRTLLAERLLELSSEVTRLAHLPTTGAEVVAALQRLIELAKMLPDKE